MPKSKSSSRSQSQIGVSISVTGHKELTRKLQGLTKIIANRAVRKALREGAKELRKGVIMNTPVKTGELKRSIKVRAAKRTKFGYGFNVLTGEGFFKGGQFYAGFLEFGTSKRGNGRPSETSEPGIKAKHFFQDGLEAKQEEAASVMAKTLKTEIDSIK